MVRLPACILPAKSHAWSISGHAPVFWRAGLNKLLDSDWRNGQFLENMEARLGRHRAFYVSISSWLPPMWLSKVMSWVVIATELSPANGFLFMEWPMPIVSLGISFYTTLLVLTGYTFAMFYYATASSYLAFLDWPASSISITSRNSNHKFLEILEKLDFDDLLRFSPDPVQPDLTPHRSGFWNDMQVVVSTRS